jgi:hypothetical protein
MTDDPRRAPGADLPLWIDQLCDALGVDRALVDIDRLLEVSSGVAHQVARPAVPVSMFVAGLAAAGADRATVDRLLTAIEERAAAWE